MIWLLQLDKDVNAQLPYIFHIFSQKWKIEFYKEYLSEKKSFPNLF